MKEPFFPPNTMTDVRLHVKDTLQLGLTFTVDVKWKVYIESIAGSADEVGTSYGAREFFTPEYILPNFRCIFRNSL